MADLDQVAPPLSGQDAGYLRRESDRQPMHFVILSHVAPSTGPVTVEAVRAQIRRRLHRVPMLRRKVLSPPFGVGPMRWIDDADFDLGEHVRRWPDVTDDVDRVTAGLLRVTEQRLDRRRPLWRIHVGERGGDVGTVIAFCAHHALMDGGLLINVYQELFGTDPSPDGPTHPWAPRARPGRPRLLASGLAEAARRRLEALRVSESPSPDHGQAGGAVPRSHGSLDDGVLAGPVSSHRRAATLDLPLADLQRLRTATGATINDLYVTAVTRGLRDLQTQRTPASVGRPLVALIPRDVRDDGDASTAGNRTWSMFVPLPIGTDDVRQRLHEVRLATQDAKRADGPAGTGSFRFDVTLSNVALGGPHAVAGVPITHHHATVPLQGHNRLAVLAISSIDAFSLSFTADAPSFPDLDVLVEGTATGFEELFDLAAGRIGR